MCCGGDNVKITIARLDEMSMAQTKVLFDCNKRWAYYLKNKKTKKRIMGVDKAVHLVVMGLIRKNKGK